MQALLSALVVTDAQKDAHSWGCISCGDVAEIRTTSGPFNLQMSKRELIGVSVNVNSTPPGVCWIPV